MRVLDVYEGNKEGIICDGVDVFYKMDTFFDRYPYSYRENYDKNIRDLMIYRVDENYSLSEGGNYFAPDNIITFNEYQALPHELIHMSSNDRENNSFAIIGRFNNRVVVSIQDTFNSLIDIELSYDKNSDKLKIYRDEFMDLLGDETLSDVLKYTYPDYKNYAYHEIKKRIKIRNGLFRR